ncbi:MAG: CapA family protein, partial [Actinomycetota bacterium]|nr:CapA family protein [Actinomycetota bacterium]
ILGVAGTTALIGGRDSGADSSAPVSVVPIPATTTSAPATAHPATTQMPSTAPTTTTTTTTTPRSATIALTGDIITHLALGREGRRNAYDTEAEYDFEPLFAQIAPTISSADLAICHLESPLAFGGRFSPFPRFNGPFELAEAIAGAGFDGCSTASNHAYDQLADGVDATLDVLDAAGLQHAGTARSEAEASLTTMYSVNGIRVAHLSYTYWINGFDLDPDDLWRVNIIDPAKVAHDAQRARDDGAEFVIASLHWGKEYLRLPSNDQLAWAEAIAATGLVDLIAGHHAHVLQPITTIQDTFVLYGLGNLLSNQEPKCCTAYSQDGVVAEVRIGDSGGKVAVTGFEFTPTWVDRTTMQVVPVVERLSNGEELPRWIRVGLELSLERTLDSLAQLDFELPPPR